MRVYFENESYTVAMPIAITETHEGGLDQAAVTLPWTKRKEPFEPFTRARFDGKWWVVTHDHAVYNNYNGLTSHSLQLVELAKELEGVSCGAKTFTDPLSSDPIVPQAPATPIFLQEVLDNGVWRTDFECEDDPSGLHTYVTNRGEYITPQTTQNIILPSPESRAWHDGYSAAGLKLVRTRGFYSVDYGDWVEFTGNSSILVDPGQSIRVKYTGETIENATFRYATIFEMMRADFVLYSFARNPLTIFEEVERLLITATPTLDASKRAYFHTTDIEGAINTKEIDAPEFSFANSALLKENLDQIAKYLHAKTKLTIGEDGRAMVYFIPLTVPEREKIRGDKVGDESTSDALKHAGRVETNATNLTIKNAAEGAMTEPFGGSELKNRVRASKTLRARDNEARIDESTGEIETSLPIKSIRRLLVRTPNAPHAANPFDITKYVYEETRYLSLSSYAGEAGRSYALFFTRGQKNIKGLFEKEDDALSSVFKNYSILNVINHAWGTSFDKGDSFRYSDLSFIVEYEPYIDIRLVNSRTDGKGGNITYIVNQNANETDKDALAAFVHGNAQQMASASRKVTYLMNIKRPLPRVGYLFDDTHYISAISYLKYPYYHKVTISISENYNRLGEYTEVSNAIRDYEISTKNIRDRSVLYTDVCTISTEKKGADDASLNDMGIGGIINFFGAGNGSCLGHDNRLSLSYVTTHYAKHERNVLPSVADAVPIKTVVLPVATFGFGNSLVFSAAFEDAFSAGKVAKLTSGKHNRTEYVAYGDAWGCAEFCDFSLAKGLLMKAVYDQSIANSLTTASIPALGRQFPNVPAEFAEGTALTGNICMQAGKLHLFKDSRERIILTYQLLFESDCGLIIGNELANTCPLVRDYSKVDANNTEGVRLNLYSRKIDPINGSTKEGDLGSYVNPFYTNNSERSLRFDTSNISASDLIDHKAWSITWNGKFLFGANTQLPRGEKLYFNFHHK